MHFLSFCSIAISVSKWPRTSRPNQTSQRTPLGTGGSSPSLCGYGVTLVSGSDLTVYRKEDSKLALMALWLYGLFSVRES